MLTTARLLLRPPRPSDAASFFAFLGDPAAMRFTHCHASVRECRRRLAAFEWQRRRAGFAPWAVLTQGDGQLVGWGGLYEDPFDPGWGVELGYSLHPAAWGLSSDIRNPSGGDTENPSTPATVLPRPGPERVSP